MIRKIDKTEIPECAALIKESFLTVAEEFGFTQENAPRFTAFATTPERLMWQYEEGRLMAACVLEDEKAGFEKGRLIGYYSIADQKDGSCELNNLCVHPSFRHRKIGELLLKDAFLRAKEAGFGVMNIGIVEENAVLRKWYEDFGFVHIGTQKFDFFPFICGYMKRKVSE